VFNFINIKSYLRGQPLNIRINDEQTTTSTTTTITEIGSTPESCSIHLAAGTIDNKEE
jgi:hypothetical protein